MTAAAPQLIHATLAQLNKVILGKEQQVRLALTCLLANGHLLLEDLPGMGKTTLAHALATVCGLDYKRVQFTSDLLPADVIGATVFEAHSGQFRFHPVRCLARFFWRMNSIVPAPKRKVRCWNRWKNNKSALTARVTVCPRHFS